MTKWKIPWTNKENEAKKEFVRAEYSQITEPRSSDTTIHVIWKQRDNLLLKTLLLSFKAVNRLL